MRLSLRIRAVAAIVMLTAVSACRAPGENGAPATATPTPTVAAGVAIDSARLMSDLQRLAHDSLRGREAGTPENAVARRWIASEFDRIGLEVVGSAREHPFRFLQSGATDSLSGVNVVGAVRGTEHPERYVVVTAHFDHVGVGRPVNGDSIYNGADDNASGTVALVHLAAHFRRNPLRHSLLLVAFDAEEKGLRGARAFVASPPVPREAIVLNVNMDMVSVSERNELYAAGAAKYPQLRAPLERAAARAHVSLLLGHDEPVPAARDDWTMLSDQGAFHEAGIPFVYFGVEDHPHYHRPSDELRNVTQSFYYRAVRTIGEAIELLDGAL